MDTATIYQIIKTQKGEQFLNTYLLDADSGEIFNAVTNFRMTSSYDSIIEGHITEALSVASAKGIDPETVKIVSVYWQAVQQRKKMLERMKD